MRTTIKYTAEITDAQGKPLLMVVKMHESADPSGSAEWTEIEFHSPDYDALGTHHWSPIDYPQQARLGIIQSLMISSMIEAGRLTLHSSNEEPTELDE